MMETQINPTKAKDAVNATTAINALNTASPAAPVAAGSPVGMPTATHSMRVKKRDGRLEPVNVLKIVDRVTRLCGGLNEVDPHRVAIRAISGLYDGATTKELDDLCVQTASLLISEEPQYSLLAARLLSTYVDEEVVTLGVRNFHESVAFGFAKGIISKDTNDFVVKNREKLEAAINPARNTLFEYFGLRTVHDRYLLKDPKSRAVFETPQYFFMRVACGLAQSAEEAIELYELISRLDYMPSTPTLFNSATLRPQMSSCYLLDSPQDDLSSIYSKYTDIALLSKFAGGIGVAYHRVRSRGSLIKGTNGHSNGIVPWLKTLDSSVAAVNQGGKRKGACCVYLESWHADIEEFLELRDNTGDEAKRTHNLNLANWVPDLFMARVEADQIWSLFDPKVVPHFTDLFGREFETAYLAAEEKGQFVRQVKARDLYARMMKTLAQTGNGWMTFKDASNTKANQTKVAGNVIHLSNLCTEILEVTSDSETAVCNLGSVNLGRHISTTTGVAAFDFEKLTKTVRTAVKFLDRVIDINYYPTPTAGASNSKWRPVGLGVMGLQDAFFRLRLPFDSAGARELSRRVQEEIYFVALETSCELAEKFGAHPAFKDTRAADGVLQFDLWGVKPTNTVRWEALRQRIVKSGLRNSLLIAIAPTATIASIVGSYESIEPMVSNLFKRETLSGEFLQVNKYLIEELKGLNLWNDRIRNEIKKAEGSIQGISEIPATVREIYRTAWELPMKALIEMGAERGAFIDQSASLNLFQESPTIGKLSSMYMYAWKQGIKSTYYLRSRPATSIAKTNTYSVEEAAPTAAGNAAAADAALHAATAAVLSATAAAEAEAAMLSAQSAVNANAVASQVGEKKIYSDSEAIACSLENPEACEACS
ncbi:ribonucleoside-diphosphate reductase subunit alpha [soil metagenome]